jgi:hypothetical protein
MAIKQGYNCLNEDFVIISNLLNPGNLRLYI